MFLLPVLVMFSTDVSEFEIGGNMLRITMLLTCGLFFICMIAIIVYKDASKRGMDPWYWATVASFVPLFIGVIVYLLERRSVKRTCLNCGEGLQENFKVCPYCGQNQEISCEKCQKAIAPDWKLCPYCGAVLHKEQEK